MYKLLNAGFTRLKKNKIFWFTVIVTITIACFMLVSRYFDGIKLRNDGMPQETIDDWLDSTDDLLISFINFIGFFIAFFTSLFVGTEYSNGTIRNKIIVGHSRKNIYLSNLIISIVVGLLLEFIYFSIVLAVAIPIFGGIQMALSDFGFIVLDMIMIIVAYSSIFTFVSLNYSNITLSTVICFLLMLVMFVAAGAFSSYFPSISVIVPVGQAMNLANSYTRSSMNVEILSLYSLGLATVINVLGLILFKNKELK